MQIHLFFSNGEFDKDLRERINEVKDFYKYINIFPKSIQVNINFLSDCTFIELLLKIFDNSITSFNKITWKYSSKNLHLLSNIAKKLNIFLLY